MNSRFQFGLHPNRWMWNEKGERIIHSLGNDSEDIHINLILSTSEWLKRLKGDAAVYLLKNTLQIL
jgi:hypothetical protein